MATADSGAEAGFSVPFWKYIAVEIMLEHILVQILNGINVYVWVIQALYTESLHF